MAETILKPHVFLSNQTSAGSSDYVFVDRDYQYIQRSISGTKDTADTIKVIIKTEARDTSGNLISIENEVISWGAGVTSFTTAIQSPFTAVKVTKEGTAGAANVVGYV